MVTPKKVMKKRCKVREIYRIFPSFKSIRILFSKFSVLYVCYFFFFREIFKQRRNGCSLAALLHELRWDYSSNILYKEQTMNKRAALKS
jgi:hypothetical protein